MKKTKNNIKKDYFWNTLGSGFVSINSLLFLIIVTRVNGINVAGIFTLMFATANILYCIGIYSGRTYQVTESNENITDYEYVIHRLISITLMILAMIIFIFINDYKGLKLMILLLLTLSKCIESLSDVLHGILQKNNKLYVVGYSLLIRSIINILLFTLIDILTKNIIYSCLALVISNLFILFLFDIKNTNEYLKNKIINKNNVLLIFKLGFSIFFITLINNYLFNIPRYILDINLSQYQTIYGIIIMPATIIILISQFILQPLITVLKDHYYNKNKKEFLKCIKKINITIVVWGIISIIICSLIGIPVLNIIYNLSLGKYLICLIIILISSICYTIASVFSNVLIIYRKNIIQLIIYIFVTFFSILMSKYLISNFEFNGAIYSVLATMVLLLIVYIISFIITNKKERW